MIIFIKYVFVKLDIIGLMDNVFIFQIVKLILYGMDKNVYVVQDIY
jgi:hypothetical protein